MFAIFAVAFLAVIGTILYIKFFSPLGGVL